MHRVQLQGAVLWAHVAVAPPASPPERPHDRMKSEAHISLSTLSVPAENIPPMAAASSLHLHAETAARDQDGRDRPMSMA